MSDAAALRLLGQRRTGPTLHLPAHAGFCPGAATRASVQRWEAVLEEPV